PGGRRWRPRRAPARPARTGARSSTPRASPYGTAGLPRRLPAPCTGRTRAVARGRRRRKRGSAARQGTARHPPASAGRGRSAAGREPRSWPAAGLGVRAARDACRLRAHGPAGADVRVEAVPWMRERRRGLGTLAAVGAHLLHGTAGALRPVADLEGGVERAAQEATRGLRVRRVGIEAGTDRLAAARRHGGERGRRGRCDAPAVHAVLPRAAARRPLALLAQSWV